MLNLVDQPRSVPIQIRVIKSVRASGHTWKVLACSYHYSFVGPDGTEYSGSSIDNKQKLNVDRGETVRVEYPKDQRQRSLIRSLSYSPVGLWSLAMAAFPLIGFVMVIKVLMKGNKANRLLQHGLQTTGKLISKINTGVRVGGSRHRNPASKPIYRLTLEFNLTHASGELKVAEIVLRIRRNVLVPNKAILIPGIVLFVLGIIGFVALGGTRRTKNR